MRQVVGAGNTFYPNVGAPSAPPPAASAPAAAGATPYAAVGRPSAPTAAVPVTTAPISNSYPTMNTPAAPVTTAQAASPAPPSQAAVFRAGDIRTIQEAGKSPIKCHILRVWRTPEGLQACEMQSLETGEKMTIVESGPVTTMQGTGNTRKLAMATRIFHWDRSGTPPTDAPRPPAVVNSTPAVAANCPQCNGPVVMEVAPRPTLGQRIQNLFAKAPAPQVVPPPVNAEPLVVTQAPPFEIRGTPLPDLACKPKAEPVVVVPPPVPLVVPPVKVAVPQAELPGKPKAEPVVVVTPPPPVSMVKTKQDDPLTRPEFFMPRSVEQKLIQPKPPIPPVPPTTTGLVAGMGVQGSQPTEPSSLPLGSKSVIEAYNGMTNKIKYLPVPVVTVPEPHRPPLPPVPQIPQAPQQNAYVNAWTPPQAYNIDGSVKQAPMPAQPPMMTPPGMPSGLPPATGQMYPPGYGPNPYMMPPGYNPQLAQGPWPRTYQGPLPPNVQPLMPMPMMPAGYPAPGMMPANPAMDRRPVVQMSAQQSATQDSLEQMVYVLRTSVYPSQREWAANNLTLFDWRTQPQVVLALLEAAKQDPAPTVRASCAYNLARMQVKAEPVVLVLQQLKSDSDPRVRREAELALAKLVPAGAPTPAQLATQSVAPAPVQPAQAVQPAPTPAYLPPVPGSALPSVPTWR